jgi:hypothetical protein
MNRWAHIINNRLSSVQILEEISRLEERVVSPMS